MSTEKTYEDGIQEGVKRCFDYLLSVSANTTWDEKATILSDVAEDMLADAPTFQTAWLELKEYGKRLREGAMYQNYAGVIVANDPVHGWNFKPSRPWNELGAGTKLYTASLATMKLNDLVLRLAQIEGYPVPPKEWGDFINEQTGVSGP